MKKILEAWKVFEFIRDHQGKLSSKRIMAYAAFISGLIITIFTETTLGGLLPAQVGTILMAVAYFLQRLTTLEGASGGDLEDNVKQLIEEIKNKK